MSDSIEDEILRSLRRITRAIDLHSKQLAATFGLTGPQLVCLRTIGRSSQLTPSELARKVSLSQATVTGILDRLVARQLVTRRRMSRDRRHIHVTITQAGADLIAAAPSPLQEKFAVRLAALDTEERYEIQEVLERVVRMMDGADLDVAPVMASPSTEREILDPTLEEEAALGDCAIPSGEAEEKSEPVMRVVL